MHPLGNLKSILRGTIVFLSILTLESVWAHQSYYGGPASRYSNSHDQNSDHLLLFELPDTLSNKILDKTREHLHPTIQPQQAQQITQLNPIKYTTHYAAKPVRATAQSVEHDAEIALQSLVQSHPSPQRHYPEERSISLTIPISALQDVPQDHSSDMAQVEPETHRPADMYSLRQQPRHIQMHPAVIGGHNSVAGNLYASRPMPQLSHKRLVGDSRLIELAPVNALDYVTMASRLNFLTEQNEPAIAMRPKQSDNEIIGQLLQQAFEQLLARRQTNQLTAAHVVESSRQIELAQMQSPQSQAHPQPILWRDSIAHAQAPAEVLSREPEVNRTQEVSQELSSLLNKLATSSPELLIKMRNILRRASAAKSHSNGTYMAVASLHSAAAQAKLAEPQNLTEAHLLMQNRLPLLPAKSLGGGELASLLSFASQQTAGRNVSSNGHDEPAKIVVISMPRSLQPAPNSDKGLTNQSSSAFDSSPNSTDSAEHRNSSSRWTTLDDESGGHFGRSTNSSAPLAPYLFSGGSSQAGSYSHSAPTTSAPLHTMAPYAHLFSSPLRPMGSSASHTNYSAGSLQLEAEPQMQRPLDWLLRRAPHHLNQSFEQSSNELGHPLHSSASPKQLIFLDASGLHTSPQTANATDELEQASAPKLFQQPTSAATITRINLLEALSRLKPLFQSHLPALPLRQQQQLDSASRLSTSHSMSLSPTPMRADRRTNARTQLQSDATTNESPKMLFMIV